MRTPPQRLELEKIRRRRSAIGQKTGFGDFFFGLLRKTAGAVYHSQLSIVHVSCVEATQTSSSVLISLIRLDRQAKDPGDEMNLLASRSPSLFSVPSPKSQFGF
jgi:hypothetical protein